MATSAAAMPASASRLGRWPNSARLHTTGTTAAQIAVTGETTLIVPWASAWYSTITPTAPAMPPTAPSTRSRPRGPSDATNGRATSTVTKPTSCDPAVTVHVAACRVALPPQKSATPYTSAHAAARISAITDPRPHRSRRSL